MPETVVGRDSSIGNDSIGNDSIGRDSAGRDVQYITLNAGDRTPREIADLIDNLPEISEIVFGKNTGFIKWDGVVREIQNIQDQMSELSQKMGDLQRRMTIIESKLGDRSGMDDTTLIFMRVMMAAGSIAVLAQVWQILFR